MLENELQGEILWIQNKAATYIDGLEKALNETKIQKDREINRLMQTISDIEGQRMREIIPDPEISDLLKQNHTSEVYVITEAHKIITSLKNAIRTVNYENHALRSQLNSAKNTIKTILDSRNLMAECFTSKKMVLQNELTDCSKIYKDSNFCIYLK